MAQQKRKVTARVRLLWWLNLVGVLLLAVPMAITPLKGLMFEHHYGIVSSVAVVGSFLIAAFLKHEQEHPYPDDDDDSNQAGA
jgi:hypothetical protein